MVGTPQNNPPRTRVLHGWAALNSAKHLCARGHQLAGSNIKLRIRRGGVERACLECRRYDKRNNAVRRGRK